MRQISVRVWHTKIESFVSPSQYIIIDKDGELSNDDCVIEQFTGLHDKNGVKIFEGDIIHLQLIHNYTGSVEFQNGTFCMVSAEKEIIVRSLGELFSHHIYVIGNIHKNPKLLEK